MVLLTYWQNPPLIVHADAVEPAVLMMSISMLLKSILAAKALVSLKIYTGSPKPSFLKTAISAKIKCAGSFHLFFALLD